MILSFYKEKVTDVGGAFNKKAHDKFLQEYKGSLENFLHQNRCKQLIKLMDYQKLLIIYDLKTTD